MPTVRQEIGPALGGFAKAGIQLRHRHRRSATAETRYKGPKDEGANTITPREFQVPPRPSPASQITCIGPPDEGTLFSFPSEKKAIQRPSGDQKGNPPISFG